MTKDNNYSINPPTGDGFYEENAFSLSEPNEERRLGNSSSFFASYNVICTVVGTGLLQLPFGLEETGWIGVFILVGLAFVAGYTATLLIKCMKPPSGKKLYTYSEIGKEAFGIYGSLIVDLMLHATLIGVATIYLILSGENLSTLLADFPSHSGDDSNFTVVVANIAPFYCILIVACLMWMHVWLKTLHEVGFLSAFNVLVAVFLLVVVLLEIFTNIPSPKPDHNFINFSGYGLSLAGGFVSFAFSYGAHAVLPTVYETMKKPHQFNLMIILTFIGILGFYLPMSISGYWAFGTGTQSPIYNNICETTCTFIQSTGKWLAIFAITLHIMLSYAIVLNPTERAIERLLGIDEMKRSLVLRVAIRTAVVLITVLIAVIIPDFGDFLNLVSSCTNTATTFVFPCLFHLVLFKNELRGNYVIIAINLTIIIGTSIIGFFGAIGAINGILNYVFGVGF